MMKIVQGGGLVEKLYVLWSSGLSGNHQTENSCMFYVGNQGNFDRMVRSVLKETTTAYPGVGYAVVLAYMPSNKSPNFLEGFSDTMLPEGIEKVPKRYAIPWRNKWMIDHSCYVITYVLRSCGGAAKFTALARKKGKTLFPLNGNSQYNIND